MKEKFIESMKNNPKTQYLLSSILDYESSREEWIKILETFNKI